jgi:hypothetical protein
LGGSVVVVDSTGAVARAVVTVVDAGNDEVVLVVVVLAEVVAVTVEAVVLTSGSVVDVVELVEGVEVGWVVRMGGVLELVDVLVGKATTFRFHTVSPTAT